MVVSEPLPPHVSLLPNEKIIMTLRRRYPSIFSSILSLVSAGLLLGGSSTIRYIGQYAGSFENVVGLLYLVIIAVAVFFAIAALIGYFYVHGHLYILTDRRIIVSTKFITISVRDVAYSEITDIIVNQGPLGRILNYGSVVPLSPGVRGVYALPYPSMRRFSYAKVGLKDVSQPTRIMDELFGLTRLHRSVGT